MRLHSLTIQAFGPYAARQEIDFDRLTSSGLFLLEGPTGVGKTMILDAVTFALYGGLAGEDSGQDRLHSHFADPGVEPEVSLEFSLRGVRHKITRSPEYQRPKLRGAGFTTQAMRVHLQRADRGGGWESRSSNKSEVAEMVGEAIGLSRDQFTQVMLLPQGEFARFLRSDDDARRTVLTKIFGTQLFDRITAELDRRRAQAVRDRQAAEEDIAAAVAAAAEAAGLDGGQRDELLALRPEERAVRLKQISEEQDALAALAEQGRELTAGQARAALTAERQATARSELMRRLTGALAALDAHEASRAEQAERVARLDAARRAGPVRPLLAVLSDAESGTAAAREQVRQVAAAATAEFAEAAQLADGTDRASVVNAAARAADRAAEGLRAAGGLEYLVAAEAALPAAEEAAAELDRVAAAAAAEVGSLEAARRDLPAQIAGLEAELIEAKMAAGTLDAASQRQRDLAALARSAARLAEIGPLLAAADERRHAAVDAHQRLVDAHQQAMDARLAGMSGELAGGLVPGQPCPVCGSAEHPAPAPAGADPVTGQTVAAARERRDEAQRARELAEREHASLDREAAECAARLGGQTMTALAEQAAAAAAAVAAGEEAVLVVTRLEPELAALRDRLDRLGDDLMAATERRSAAQRDAELKRADLAERRAEVTRAAAGYQSVAARQAASRA
ncbi:MAG: AAA family ATPase, partial [Streptosporangiaceae bacterium]